MRKLGSKILMSMLFLALTIILVPTTLTYAAGSSVSVSYRTHVQDYGWQRNVSNGALSGTTGQAKRIEAICISISGDSRIGIQYSTHVQDYGWQNYVNSGTISGTTGQSKRVEAIKIRLTGTDANKYDIYYRLHVQDYGWLDWAKNGEAAGTEGLSKRVEAIQIIMLPAGSNSGFSTATPFIRSKLLYNTHIQDIGWQNYVADNAMSGTTGQSKRIEAIHIKLQSGLPSGSIVYSAHVQDYGWTVQVKDGELSGTVGQEKRIEAIKINLSGEVANSYDVYYRVYIQNQGWLGWGIDGQIAGSVGIGLRIEAIQIEMVAKGGAAPTSQTPSFLTATGIDVSNAQGEINWDAVKASGIQFAILKCGIGDNYENTLGDQDDKQFLRNVQECERLHIPWGTYLYSYAKNVTGSYESAESEYQHIMRLLQGKHPTLPVYIDMEEETGGDYVAIADYICSKLKSSGYNSGIYSNLNWWNSYLKDNRLDQYERWVAQYYQECQYDGSYHVWQYASDGVMPGISGNVDLDMYLYK